MLNKQKRLSSEKDYYIKHKYSKPIILSKNKIGVFMTFIIRNKKYTGGKAIGDEMFYIFEKLDKDWIF